MRKCFVCFLTTLITVFFFLIPFCVSAAVYVPDVNILVRASASTDSYDYPLVTLSENSFVQVVNSGSNALTNASVRISFVSSSFVPGVEYSFKFVIASPNAPISVNNGSVAGSFIPSNGSALDLTWGSDINFSLVDSSVYPNPFVNTGSFDYVTEAYFISGSFIPNDDSGVMTVDVNFSADSFIFVTGYSYLSFSASDEAYNQGMIYQIYNTVDKIYNNLVSGFSSLNTSVSSLSSFLQSALSNIQSSISLIQNKLDSLYDNLGISLTSIEHKLDNILSALGGADIDSSAIDSIDQSSSDLKDANDKLQDDLTDINNAQDQFEQDSKLDSDAVDNILSSYPVNSNGIISNISGTVLSLDSGIRWVSSFLGLALGFQPVYMLLFVFSFIRIFMMLLNMSLHSLSLHDSNASVSSYRQDRFSRNIERSVIRIRNAGKSSKGPTFRRR